jgi:hypothetical protein
VNVKPDHAVPGAREKRPELAARQPRTKNSYAHVSVSAAAARRFGAVGRTIRANTRTSATTSMALLPVSETATRCASMARASSTPSPSEPPSW